MRSTTFLWVLVGVLVLACGFLGFRWYVAQTQLHNALVSIAQITAIPGNLTDFRPVVLVKADGSIITYRVPRADTVGGQTFINYDTRTASYDVSRVRFAGALAGGAADALLALPEGTNISMLFSADGTQVYQVYITPQK